MALKIPPRLRKKKPASGARFLTPCSTDRMEAGFGSGQSIRLGTLADIKDVSLDEIHMWCLTNAVYQVPVQELMVYIQKLIKGRKAIEICAGCGVIGRALNIPRTDSYIQGTKVVREYYEMIGQRIVQPPPDVEKLEAVDAVRKYNPEVVVACWPTQLWKGPEDVQASIHGVDESAILRHPSVKSYIVVGNEDVHGQKRILSKSHRREKHPFLVSRATDQKKNCIYVWGG